MQHCNLARMYKCILWCLNYSEYGNLGGIWSTYFDRLQGATEEVRFSAGQSADRIYMPFDGVLQIQRLDIPNFDCLIRRARE